MHISSKLVIGTAQFGMQYGISNRAGQTSEPEVFEILTLAKSAGVDTLDTAIAYGDSERVLGRLGVAGWKVVSKIPATPDGVRDIDGWLRSEVEMSLERLGIDRLHGLLLHDAEQLTGSCGEQIARSLEQISRERLANHVGISIYDPERLPAYLEIFEPGLVQAPLNLLDRRLIESGWLMELNDLGVEVHARSCFLQGLLLMSPDERPLKFTQFADFFAVWDNWVQDSGLSPISACLQFCLQQNQIHKVVVGVECRTQLQEILCSADSPLPSLPEWPRAPEAALINPSFWNKS